LRSPRFAAYLLVALNALGFASPRVCAQSIRLHVDLTDAPRNLYHAKLNIPAKPGQLALSAPVLKRRTG